MRTGVSTKFTMADAVLLTNSEEPIFEPRLPHLEMGGEELDKSFPNIEAVQGNGLCDDDYLDPMVRHGMEIAEHIQQQMEKHGRPRREKEDVFKTVVANLEATVLDNQHVLDRRNLEISELCRQLHATT